MLFTSLVSSSRFLSFAWSRFLFYFAMSSARLLMSVYPEIPFCLSNYFKKSSMSPALDVKMFSVLDKMFNSDLISSISFFITLYFLFFSQSFIAKSLKSSLFMYLVPFWRMYCYSHSVIIFSKVSFSVSKFFNSSAFCSFFLEAVAA